MERWKIASLAGIAAAVVITGLALLLEAGRIEADVADRARTALQGEATSWATVSVSGRDVVLSGAAPADELRNMAAVRLDRLFGVREVDTSQATLLPEESPYVVTLTRGGGTVLVGGLAPSDPERKRMLARIAARLPDLGTADALELARGMPDKAFLAALDALTPAVALLANGRVMLKDHAASIDGEAASNEAYDRLLAFSPELPDGYALSAPVVVRPVAAPYAMTASLVDGRVTVSGYAPDPETRSALVVSAGAAATNADIIDTVDLASGEPEGFRQAALAAVDFLDLFASARIDIVDDRISLAGVAASPEAYRTLNSHIATFQPNGFVVEANVELPVVKPFMLTATRSGEKVTVGGFAPNAATVDEIRRAAESIAGLNGATVETTLANGAAPEFAAAAVFAIRLLQHVADGSVVVADTTITLAGQAASSGDMLEVEASVALETPEGFTVESAVQPPVISPYVWSIERNEDSVVLSGFVPSEAVRVAVRDAADDAAGDLAVTDRTGLATGLPSGIDLAAVASFAAAEVALLDEGRIELNDRVLSIKGKTADALAGRSASDAFDHGLPAGVEKGTVEIDAPSPFRFRIERQPGALIVDGVAPDEAARTRLVDLAGRLFGSTDMELTLDLAPHSPPGAEEAAANALRAAALMRSGTVVFDGASVEIDGVAQTPALVERLDTDVVAAMPPGFQTRAAIDPPPTGAALDPDACRRELGTVLEGHDIEFVDGSTALSPDSAGAIAELAATALACSDARLVVTVAGGADTTPNLLLGRAEGVVDALADAGVDRSGLEPRAGSTGQGVSIAVEDAAPEAAPSPVPTTPDPVPADPAAGAPSVPNPAPAAPETTIQAPAAPEPIGPAQTAPAPAPEPVAPAAPAPATVPVAPAPIAPAPAPPAPAPPQLPDLSAPVPDLFAPDPPGPGFDPDQP